MKINFIANMNKKVLYTTMALIATLSILTVAYAIPSWTQTITWTYVDAVKSITVTGTPTVDYGSIVGPTIKTETYLVHNDGTVEVTVTASTVLTGLATANWNANPQTIPVGGDATFTLTLTITGAGSCNVIMTPS